MTPLETYHLKRKNFIEKTTSSFNFLVSEFGFGEPIHIDTEYRDDIEYKNESVGRMIQIANAYHGYDYGYEINIFNTSQSNKNEKVKMVYYKLKEDQDYTQDYIPQSAEILKTQYVEYFIGKIWFYDESIELPKRKFVISEIVNHKPRKKGWLERLKNIFK